MKRLIILFLFFFPFLVFTQEHKELSNDTIVDLLGYEDFMPTSTCGEIIHYRDYSVSFCEEYRLSEWSIYFKDINSKTGIYRNSRRGVNFIKDPKLKGREAGNGAYYNNPYDKGHLVPASDMTNNYESLKETFFFTNCVPQHKGLNRGVMKQLESKLRGWTQELGTVVIITGWVVEDSLSYMWGEKKIENYNPGYPYIPIPNYYYKVFIDVKGNRSIAFLLPNKLSTGPLRDYIVSIDFLESKTGLDFFNKLPEDIERSFEINSSDKN